MTALLIELAVVGALFLAVFVVIARMDQRLQRIERKIMGRSVKKTRTRSPRKKE